eukprot:1137431-Pelagomonas_calceolata.AAC.7
MNIIEKSPARAVRVERKLCGCWYKQKWYTKSNARQRTPVVSQTARSQGRDAQEPIVKALMNNTPLISACPLACWRLTYSIYVPANTAAQTQWPEEKGTLG